MRHRNASGRAWLALIAQALQDHRGIISSQVVQEFLNVATRKFRPALTAEEGRAYLDTV